MDTHAVATDISPKNKNGDWLVGARRGALGVLGLGGLVLGAAPVLAAHRILYPRHSQPPVVESLSLDLESGTQVERVEFDSRDGKKLGGWFVPGPDRAAAPWPCVLLLYGYGDYKEKMVGYAKMVHEGGFAALMFDMRGSGLRKGEPVSLGYKERWDLMDAVRYVRTRPDVHPERIGALGISMGGATALLAAAEDPHIKAIVTDSAFADIADMIEPGMRAFLGPHVLPFASLIVRIAEMMLGVKSKEIRPDLAASRMGNRPLLVIHGADDMLTDPESANRLYEAAPGPKELWVVPYCDHACAPLVAPDEYKRRVNGFFARWL